MMISPGHVLHGDLYQDITIMIHWSRDYYGMRVDHHLRPGSLPVQSNLRCSPQQVVKTSLRAGYRCRCPSHGP